MRRQLNFFTKLILQYIALAHLCCYSKIPQTWCLINNINLFLAVLKAGNLRLGCQHHQVRAIFWVTDLLCLTWWKGQGSSVHLSFLRALIRFMRLTPLAPKCLPRNIITLGIWISTTKFGGEHKHWDHIMSSPYIWPLQHDSKENHFCKNIWGLHQFSKEFLLLFW